MVSPELAGGFTMIANTLLEAFARTRLAGQECQVVLAIARLTYGYQKSADRISHGQIAKITRMPRVKVAQLVSALKSKKVLSAVQNGERKPLTISINKNYDEWEPVPKKGYIPKRGDSPVTDKGDIYPPYRYTPNK